MTKNSDTERPDEHFVKEDSLLNLKMRDVLPERMDRLPSKLKTTVEKEDLEELIRFAKELGAEDGIAVSGRNIVTNEIMRMKCRIPTCWGYNSGYFCPPHSACASEMSDIVSEYDWALLLSIPAGVAISLFLTGRMSAAWFAVDTHFTSGQFIWILVPAFLVMPLATVPGLRSIFQTNIAEAVRKRVMD